MKQLLAATTFTALFAPISVSAEQITLVDPSDFTWGITPEGVAFAALQADRFTEPYQDLVRLPAGTVSPSNVKTANMYGVMLEGDMKHYACGENPKTARKISVGSCYSISSGMPHISACVSDEPRLAYLYQDRALDLLPVEQ